MADLHHLGHAEGRRRAAALLTALAWPTWRKASRDLLRGHAARLISR
jgi:hypothetical protein